jgi:proteic killer suppression protein
MIRSFRSEDTEALFRDMPVRRFQAFERTARRKLLYLHRVRVLEDLKAPPGNQREALKRGGSRSRVTAPLLTPSGVHSRAEGVCGKDSLRQGAGVGTAGSRRV